MICQKDVNIHNNRVTRESDIKQVVDIWTGGMTLQHCPNVRFAGVLWNIK